MFRQVARKLWPLALALVLLNGVVIAAVAFTGGGGDLKSAVRAAVEGEGAGEEEEEGLGPAEPDDYFIFQRSTRGGVPESSDFTRAVRQARELRSDTATAQAAQRAAAWTLEGPTNIGGRLADLAVDPTRPDTVYVAAATGGVWRTTDGGQTLQKAWADNASQSMGAIAMSNDGTLWAGTGEYRSTDDGRRWRQVGLEDSGTIGRIVTHPTNPRIVYVAAGGSLFNPGGQRGIYRSTNRGATFQRVLAAETPFSGGADLVMDPSNPNRLYAAMWDHRREPDVRTEGGTGSGPFRPRRGGN